MYNTSNINNGPRQNGLTTGFFLPARLDAKSTSQVLGFQEHDIPVLVAAKKLKPLGKPARNAPKYFATCEIETFAADAKWLRESTQIVYDYWKGKNSRKTAKTPTPDGAPAEITLAE